MKSKKIIILVIVNGLIFNFLGNNALVNTEPINSNSTVRIQLKDLNKQINNLENKVEVMDNILRTLSLWR